MVHSNGLIVVVFEGFVGLIFSSNFNILIRI
jgi:hypothetical protein